MNYINRYKKIEKVFESPLQDFIETHIIFAICTLYLKQYCKLPSINSRNYKLKEITFYAIDSMQIPSISVNVLFLKFGINKCILYYCNFIENEPICYIFEKNLYIRSPLQLELDFFKTTAILKISRVSRLLKIKIKY